MTMARGKQTCRILREIRRQIAEANGIELVTSECRYKGDCTGTCPKCEAEVLYLERQLRSRRLAGAAVSLAGISVGALAMYSPVDTAAQISHARQSLVVDEVTVKVPVETFLLKGKVLGEMTVDGIKYPAEALVGVVIMSSVTGTSSDLDGNFELEVAVGDSIKVSYIGYHDKIIPVQWPIDYMEIVLEEDVAQLDEAIVIVGMVSSDELKLMHTLDLQIINENENIVDPEKIHFRKIFKDENDDTNSRWLDPEWLDSKKVFRIYWPYKSVDDSMYLDHKEDELLITAEGYDDPVIIKVQYPKESTQKTIKFKHKKKQPWMF